MGNAIIANRDKYNVRRLYTLSMLLVLPSFLDFSKSLIGENPLFSMIMYAIVGGYAYGFAVRNIILKDIIPILFFCLLITLSYVLNGNVQYYLDKSFLIASIFFFPICSLVVFKINDWTQFFEILSPFAKAGIAFGSIVVLKGRDAQDLSEAFNYMEFSYAMSPLVMGVYIILRKKFSIINLLFFIMGLGAMISFGARAAILFTIAFVLYYELIYNSKNIILFTLVLLSITVLYFNIDNIIQFLATLPIFSDSRFLTLFLKGTLVESSSRDIIYETCQNRISNMGFDVTGFFGDRFFMQGSIYPHNFFYEIMMDFGWFFGPLILLWLSYLVLRAYFMKGYHLVTIYALLSLFGRYTISGSYIIEGKFWIFLFILLSICYNCRSIKRRPIINHKVLYS